MEQHTPQKIALVYQNNEGQAPLTNTIFDSQIDLLYEQSPFGITAQFFATIFLVITLWNVVSHRLITTWLIYMLIVSLLWLTSTIYHHRKSHLFNQHTWLILSAIFTFLSGIGWGFAGSVLIPTGNLMHQTFVVILMFGMTAGSIPFFSSILFIYALFLFPAFIPFDIWLFAQGDIYTLLGLFSLIYIPIIFASCFYVNKFLINTLNLRHKNMTLDTLNQLLEKRVINRTSELEKALSITKSTLESTADGILVVDLKGHVEYYNQKFIDMWLISNEFIAKPELQLFIREVINQIKYPKKFLQKMNAFSNNPSHESFDEIVFSENKVFEWYSKPHWMQNIIVGRVWSFRDITIRKQMEQQLAYQATHDLLTGLPNRTLLYDRINQKIEQAKRYQTKLALLFLDIDNFKLINDNFGHNLGDILLKKIAKRLTLHIRKIDTVARSGGDEFVILFIINRYKDVLYLSQKILDSIAKPIQLTNHEIVVTASIGVSIYPKDGNDAATLLKNADMAMYLAKNQDQNNFKLYDETMKQQTETNMEMQIELRNALVNNEFFLLYQPIINLKSGRIVAAEALVRWKHPRKGVLPPLQFITSAEESRIIIPLGEWVFNNACRQNKAWQQMGLQPIRMAINVSGVQLMRNNYADLVEFSLNDSQLEPQYVEIELTESIIMDDKKQNLHTIKRLKELGVNLSIDDFGTGYSSLNYLREFPVNKLKIDQSFISDCISDKNNSSIIEAIIAMGHGLKLTVLAEGIEKIGQLCFLKQYHCDEGQGFLFGQPMSAKSFAKLLSSNLKYTPWK